MGGLVVGRKLGCLGGKTLLFFTSFTSFYFFVIKCLKKIIHPTLNIELEKYVYLL